MFIESVTIDGFKSYSKRVEINGFDQSFNAITGLNGTGKSNILDAICFVLGVKNLDKVRSFTIKLHCMFWNALDSLASVQVRAKSLQELVYKQGQAGVTKATVSITFNNEDPNRCPDNQWKDKKKITVTRQVRSRHKSLLVARTCHPKACCTLRMLQQTVLHAGSSRWEG